MDTTLLPNVDPILKETANDMSGGKVGTNLKISAAVVAAFAVVLAVVLLISGSPRESAGQSGVSPSSSAALVRADSHRLSTASDGKVTFVEFLDFECGGCRAAYPLVEQLRQEYAGRVTFVVRYFPIRSHFNGERAARAVEAASQQGKFEQMYQRMFQTQSEWGNQQTPADAVFRGFATDLGLDMAAYDKAYNDPATLDRIRRDVTDGQTLGVDGTPTFFVNGQKIKPRSYNDFSKAVDAALNA
jgi:protein-disulfide isomerase